MGYQNKSGNDGKEQRSSRISKLILFSSTNTPTTFPIISTPYKIIKKLVPRIGFYPAYLNGSLNHWTGERLLAGFGDDGSERLGVRTWEVPGLLE